MINVLEGIPYQDQGVGKRKLVEEDDLLLMQAALEPGQEVPAHRANSNVHLLVVLGRIVVTLAGEKTEATSGDLIPVAPGTVMDIRNAGSERASFLIWKTPHPEKLSG